VYICLGISKAEITVELSLTVPITNSLAFLFTVLGEWYAEGKVIDRGMQSQDEACPCLVLTYSQILGLVWRAYWLA